MERLLFVLRLYELASFGLKYFTLIMRCCLLKTERNFNFCRQ